jgi:DNA-binding transcriptional LysR family regulator
MPRIEMELESNETIKQAVMAGMGISFLSLHSIGMELRHGLIGVPDVEGLPLVRSWQVVHVSSKLLSPSAEAFRYFVLEHGEAFLAREFGALQPLPSAVSPPPAPPAAPAAPSPRATRARRG